MDSKNYIKSIEELLLSEGNLLSKKVSPERAEDLLDRWMDKYDGRKLLNSMEKGKLYMDYYDNIQPSLIGSGMTPEEYGKYDSFADGLVKNPKKTYGSCPSC